MDITSDFSLTCRKLSSENFCRERQVWRKTPRTRRLGSPRRCPSPVRLPGRSAGQLEDALDFFEQVAAVQIEIEPSDSTLAVLTSLYKRLQRLADRLGQSGRAGKKERSRRLSRQILHYLLGSDLERLTDASPPGLETLGRLFQRVDLKKMSSPENQQIRHSREGFVSEWLAVSVGPLSPFRSSSSAATYDRDPEAGAVALIAASRAVFEARPRGFHGPGGDQCH